MNVPLEEQFCVVCTEKNHFPELIFGRIYLAQEDPQGATSNYIRVFGESEDYLYPQSWFTRIDVPANLKPILGQSALETV